MVQENIKTELLFRELFFFFFNYLKVDLMRRQDYVTWLAIRSYRFSCKLIIRIMDFFFLNQSKRLYIVLSRE